MTERKVAFALGGGGARGALQVGALRALFEAGHKPDLVVGTSIGAVNAAFLGMHGYDKLSLTALADAWRDAAASELLPPNYLWLTMRALFGRIGGPLEDRLRAFLAEHGITAELRFGQMQGVPVRLVVTDLNSGMIVLYGADPRQLVLEGVLASAALPPLVRLQQRDGRLLLDGGALSNLPIEPALRGGATEVIALDLSEPRPAPADTSLVGLLPMKLFHAVTQRQIELELALADARRVPVRHLPLRFGRPIAMWDFQHAEELIAAGYALARDQIAQWQPTPQPCQ
jgi:NTE family protein